MPSLPAQGGSSGTWGTQLNEFLEVAHEADGDVKFAALGSGAATGSKYLRDDRVWAVPGAAAGAELGWINVKDHGALGDGTTDDTAEIQAAFDAVPYAVSIEGGVVFFPPGVYMVSNELSVKPNTIVQGCGTTATEIRASVDLGVGKWGMKMTTYESTVVAYRDFSYLAPTSVPGVATGTVPNNMGGIQVGSRCSLDNVKVEYCKYGIGINGNHMTFHNVVPNSCYFGFYLVPQASQNDGDLVFVNCYSEGNTHSAFASSISAALETVAFHHCQFGGAYGFYREAGTPTRLWMSNVHFDTCNFEGITTGFLYAENATDTLSYMSFQNVGFTWYSTIALSQILPGKTRDALITCNEINNSTFDVSKYGPANDNLLTSMFKANLVESKFLRTKGMNNSIHATAVPLVASANNLVNVRWDNGDRQGQYFRTNGAVTRYDLMMVHSYYQCKTYDGVATSCPLGFAEATAATDKVIPVGTTGAGLNANVASGNTVNAGRYVKPDPTNLGKVMEATSYSDGPILGVATQTVVGASTLGILPRGVING